MNKTLIAYFSRAGENYFSGEMKYVKTGNTEIVANIIQEITNADIFKIEMANPYSESYMACIEEAKKDLRENKRPALAKDADNMDSYDTIILAYPNYWGTIPMAVASFLEKHDFTGKKILPLCTNEGSGMGSSERDIKKYAKNAVVENGLSVSGSKAANSKTVVEKWLRSNGIL